MTQISFTFSSSTLPDHGSVALACFGTSESPELRQSEAFSSEQLSAIGASPRAEATTRSLGADGGAFVILGIGKTAEPTVDQWRDLGGALGRKVKGDVSVQLALGTLEQSALVAVLEGLALGAYEPVSQKHDRKPVALAKVHVVGSEALDSASLLRIEALVRATHLVRDLSITPANQLYPAAFAEVARQRAETLGLHTQVWDEAQLAHDGFGAITAVGQGSARKPRLVKISYSPAGASAHVAVVGKGITFDSGGYAIKPLAGMFGMKYDMTGAAVALASVLAAAELGLPVRVTAWLCLAENMVSSTSIKPGDVIKARNGKTIEVVNPDAEGRLVMADGLAAASEEQPDLLIDVATLTGAARTALGTRYAALMGTSQGIAIAETAAENAGELVWNMPFPAELRTALNSPVADIANAKIGVHGGTLVAGHFLREFVGERPDGTLLEWAHFDIAGPADNENAAYGYTPKGPTGVIVRTVIGCFESFSVKTA